MSEASETAAPAAELAAPEVAEAIAQGPGAKLRLAREARGLAVADVVQVIRFSAHQIEALERDDYSVLPGPTSVRGLVRNYAKLLKMDPTPLLAQLEPSVPVPEADVRPPANMGEAEQAKLAERVPLRVVAGAALLVVLVLAGFWLLDAGVGTSVSTEPKVAEPPRNPPPVAEPVPAPVSQPAQATPPATAESAPAPAGGLRVEFDEKSWIEIRDASGKIVLVGEYPGGVRQAVEGKPPFQAWIGRASGVRLYMDERAIDLKPHTREEVARLTVE